MRNRLFAPAAILSALMAMVSLLWLYHSRSHLDMMQLGNTVLMAKGGKLVVQYPSLLFGGHRWFHWLSVPYDLMHDPMPVEFRWPTFGYITYELKNTMQRTVVFPLWLAAIVFSILPAMWARRRLPRMRSVTHNRDAQEHINMAPQGGANR